MARSISRVSAPKSLSMSRIRCCQASSGPPVGIGVQNLSDDLQQWHALSGLGAKSLRIAR